MTTPDAPTNPPDAPTPQPTVWQRTKDTFKRLGPAGPLAVFTSTFPPIGGFVLLGLITRISPWLRENRDLGLFIYVMGFALSASLSMLPTYACSILGGWAFGFAIGLPAAMLAFTLATLFAWWVNSTVAGERVMEIVKEHPKWEAVRKALVGRGFRRSFFILMLIRIPPTSPFAAVNFIAPTIRAPLGAFVLATIIGMTPRTAAVVWAAANMSTLDMKAGANRTMFFVGLAITFFVVWWIGHIANRAIQKVADEHTLKPA